MLISYAEFEIKYPTVRYSSTCSPKWTLFRKAASPSTKTTTDPEKRRLDDYQTEILKTIK